MPRLDDRPSWAWFCWRRWSPSGPTHWLLSGRTATLPANLVPFLAAIIGLLLVARVVTRRLAPGADGVLLPIALLLSGLAYVFIARINPTWRGGRPTGPSLVSVPMS
jgi:hypothetical protein